MSHLERWTTTMVTLLLRLAVIFYLFAALYPFINDPGFESTFGNWSLRWMLIIITGAATLTFFILKRSVFLLYGFFVVLFLSLYQIFSTLTADLSVIKLLLHFYALATSIYFVTRDIRVKAHGSSRRRSHKSKD